jgi:hypothetical protein
VPPGIWGGGPGGQTICIPDPVALARQGVRFVRGVGAKVRGCAQRLGVDAISLITRLSRGDIQTPADLVGAAVLDLTDPVKVVNAVFNLLDHPCLLLVPGYETIQKTLPTGEQRQRILSFIKLANKVLSNPDQLMKMLQDKLGELVKPIPGKIEQLLDKTLDLVFSPGAKGSDQLGAVFFDTSVVAKSAGNPDYGANQASFQSKTFEGVSGKIGKFLEDRGELTEELFGLVIQSLGAKWAALSKIFTSDEWWQLIKKFFWGLLWPWDNVGKTFKKIWGDLNNLAGKLWNKARNIPAPRSLDDLKDWFALLSDAVDDIIKLWGDLNQLLHELSLWISIAIILVGAAFFGVGAVAGLGVALQVLGAIGISTVAQLLIAAINNVTSLYALGGKAAPNDKKQAAAEGIVELLIAGGIALVLLLVGLSGLGKKVWDLVKNLVKWVGDKTGLTQLLEKWGVKFPGAGPKTAPTTRTVVSPSGLEVTYDAAGKPVQWRWKVGGKGERGPGYREVDVPQGQHRGHVKAVNEGAGVNPIDDGAPNIIPQTPTVNLSNVKRFENWRVANAQGQEVIVTQLPNGYQRWQVPGKNIDVTFNPQSTTRWPDNWFLKGGTFD